MTVVGKVAPALAHIEHKLSRGAINKLPLYAKNVIRQTKHTLENYHREAQKALGGKSGLTFTHDVLAATVKCAEQQIAAVDSMFSSMIQLAPKKVCGKQNTMRCQ